MEKLKVILNRSIGRVYVPKYIRNRSEEVILHISDTPYSFFYALKDLIKKINPEYIIHTGDLVDNIKLEFCHYSLYRYSKRLEILVDILSKSSAKKTYICLGNHDKKEVLKSMSDKIDIIDICENIRIKDLELRMSHYSSEIIKDPQEYNLYGHNLDIKNKIDNGRTYLNGIQSINIIYTDTKKVEYLAYPFGIDDERLRKGKIGL
ncbi:MAG: metallophosphoesterase [Tepidibacter sp.]|jgi:predicted MPP superfamily phosphohydrolase|uniref:metallophosphoesterase n=1 Tax=Tepidibacter sp. TaxID=2529387 RepID=UPI0025F6BB4D|nr:metallophosphoesterase [Tepidibacter sp.]MCT4508959.1 metallophosphoesterase [Tepidibacter sp.]